MIKLKVVVANITALLVCLSFAACEQDATNVDIPVIEPKLVVQSFISPQDTLIKVFVSLTRPVYNGNINNNGWITDADVKISDGLTTKQLLFDGLSGTKYTLHTSQMPIVAGKTYTLMVNTKDGRSAKATCTVPYPADTASLTYKWDTTANRDDNVGQITRTVKLNMSWNDIAGGVNYYRAGSFVRMVETNGTPEETLQTMYGPSYSDLQTDKNKDGQKIAMNDLSAEVYEQIGGTVMGFSFRPIGIRVYLLSCDENYYKYHKTAVNNGGDPFSEPTLVFSNVQGGLGCFGAYNEHVKIISF